MINLANLQDDSIILCPNNIKKVLVKERTLSCPSKNIKFIDKNELFENLYFSFDFSAIYYVYKNFKYNYPNSEEIVRNLYDIKSVNKKTEELVKIYTELKKNNLLKFNVLYINLLKNKKIYIVGYSDNDIELLTLLNEFNLEYTFLKEEKPNIKHKIYKFKNMEEEVKYVFNKIMSLVESGVSLNDIYLYKFNNDYNNIINKYARYHNIKIEGLSTNYLLNSPVYKSYIELLKENDIKESYELLKEKYAIVNHNELNLIVKCAHELSNVNLDKNDFIDALDYLAGKTRISKTRYDNSLKIINCDDILSNNSHVFILDFSLENFPVVHKDTDFFLDQEKVLLNKNTSKILNTIEGDKIIKFLNNNYNFYITFKEKNKKIVYYPSLLIEKLGYTIEDGLVDNIRYSDSLVKVEVGKDKDLNYCFGIKNKYLNNYTNEEIKYRKFNYSFSGLEEYRNDSPLKISYSQIELYNKCPFQYFYSKVLGSDIYEESFAATLGTVFHKILEDSFDKDVELKDYEEYLKEMFKNPKDLVLANNLINQVIEVIKLNKEYMEISTFNKALKEENIEMKIDDNTILEGRIDKTLIDEENKNIVVVDYKTNDTAFKSHLLNYGLGMQLPIYALLLEHKFPDYTPVGLYIQNILVNLRDEKTAKHKYKLKGITKEVPDILERLEPEIEEKYQNQISDYSRFIYNCNTVRNDLEKKFFTDEDDWNYYIELTKIKVKETIDNIRNGVFPIEPKTDGRAPCEYCNFRKICFREEKDIIYIKKENDDKGDE